LVPPQRRLTPRNGVPVAAKAGDVVRSVVFKNASLKVLANAPSLDAATARSKLAGEVHARA
jgi:hypothetical protein